MTVFWQLCYAYLGINYLVKFFGVLFDDWKLDTWQIASACFFVVLFAAQNFIRGGGVDGRPL